MKGDLSLKNFGIVVPTLGTRGTFLKKCLQSIRNAGCSTIFLVGPEDKLKKMNEITGLYDLLIPDQGTGLTGAINLGIRNLPESIKYVGWLGDDDLIDKDCLKRSIEVFSINNFVVATYGACEYITEDNELLFLNKSGQWASKFMNFLPNLIPQPGSLIERIAFDKIGGVKPEYHLSFDFEMFFNLRKLGRLHYIPAVQGSFRWHPYSLSVEQRRLAVRQTSQIRQNNLPVFFKSASFLWEPLIVNLTLLIGLILSKKSKSLGFR